MLSPLLSSGGQESSSLPPVSTWQSVHLWDLTQAQVQLKISLHCMQHKDQHCSSMDKVKHETGISMALSTPNQAVLTLGNTFSKGNGSLKSVRNESPCRDPSKQASATISWEQCFILTCKHLNLLPCLPVCSHCNLKMNLLRRTQNSTKAQISYN